MILDPYRYRSGSRSEPKSRPNMGWKTLSQYRTGQREKLQLQVLHWTVFFVKKVQSKFGSGFQIQKKKIGFDQPKAADPQQ
jgi:hypothetical protein